MYIYIVIQSHDTEHGSSASPSSDIRVHSVKEHAQNSASTNTSFFFFLVNSG